MNGYRDAYTLGTEVFDAFGIIGQALQDPRDLARLAAHVRTAGDMLQRYSSGGNDHELGRLLCLAAAQIEHMCKPTDVL
jgi:hypothetical protein